MNQPPPEARLALSRIVTLLLLLVISVMLEFCTFEYVRAGKTVVFLLVWSVAARRTIEQVPCNKN